MLAQQSGVTLEELAVDFAMVRLALDIVPNLTGYSHIQTNPRWSYNVQKTINNAESTLKFANSVQLIVTLLQCTDGSCSRDRLYLQASSAFLRHETCLHQDPGDVGRSAGLS